VEASARASESVLVADAEGLREENGRLAALLRPAVKITPDSQLLRCSLRCMPSSALTSPRTNLQAAAAAAAAVEHEADLAALRSSAARERGLQEVHARAAEYCIRPWGPPDP
jgi:hypothetical protein